MAQIITRKGKKGLSHTFRIRKNGLEWTKTFHCTSASGRCKGAGCDGGKDGETWARSIERDVDLGQAVPTTGHTVAEVIEFQITLLDQKVRQKKSTEANVEKVKRQLNWWKDRIGTLKLHEVTPRHIAEAKSSLTTGKGSPTGRSLTGSTCNRYHSAISRAWKTAVRRLHWTANNPFALVERDQENPGRERWLDADEQKQLLAAALECERGAAAKCHLWVLAGLTTGARVGELAKITWRDVSLERGELTLVGTKNGTTRLVTLHPQLAAELQRLKDAKVVSTEVFGEYPRAAFESAVRRAKLSGRVTFHTLRHTCATTLSTAGVGPRALQAYMGWKVAAMADRYVHNREALTLSLREKVNAIL